MKFDLDHEMRMKGTIAHCIADFQRFLTDVLEGLIALENRKIRSNFHTVRILVDHHDKVYVAPHNLFLLAQPSQLSRFLVNSDLNQLLEQVRADFGTQIISKNSVGKLLLKLVCLDEKTFAELQNQGSMLESYTNQILSVHKKQLAREALSSEWFIKNLMTIIRKLMVAFTSDRADLQDIRASMTRTDEQVSRLASAWRAWRVQHSIQEPRINDRSLSPGSAPKQPPMGERLHHAAMIDGPALQDSPSKQILPLNPMFKNLNTNQMFIMDSPTKRYNLLGDARPVSVGPTEKAKQEHLRSAINLKPNRTEGLPTLQESKGRIHPQPNPPIKQRDPALSKSALSTSRSSHEASINTQQQQKICVVSNVVEFEFGYLKLLQDANHANTKVLLKIPQSPLYSPIVELLTFCSSWCCVKILRTVGILSARVKLNSFYAVTELAPQLSGLCAEMFTQYLAEHPSYKTRIARQEMDNPTFKKTLEKHHSKVMRDFE